MDRRSFFGLLAFSPFAVASVNTAPIAHETFGRIRGLFRASGEESWFRAKVPAKMVMNPNLEWELDQLKKRHDKCIAAASRYEEAARSVERHLRELEERFS